MHYKPYWENFCDVKHLRKILNSVCVVEDCLHEKRVDHTVMYKHYTTYVRRRWRIYCNGSAYGYTNGKVVARLKAEGRIK